jgi:type I restriction enzyme S subunit
VAWPRLSEQRAIATALSDVDALLEGLDRLITKKRDIKQAAMQQLLTGKTRLSGFEGEWEMKRLEELVEIDPENLSASTPADYHFNYISLEQVDKGRLLGWSEERFSIAPSRARRVLRHNDVLLSTVRPNLMSHLHYRTQVPKAVCSTGFAVLRSKSKQSVPGYIFVHLFAQHINKQIEESLSGSNYPAINSRDVRQLELPCPPDVEEQQAIATIISDMDAEIEALEQRRTKTRDIKKAMMQELLTGRTRLV